MNFSLEWSTKVLFQSDFFFFSKVTALQSAQGRGTATVQQIGGGGDSVVLGEKALKILDYIASLSHLDTFRRD